MRLAHMLVLVACSCGREKAAPTDARPEAMPSTRTEWVVNRMRANGCGSRYLCTRRPQIAIAVEAGPPYDRCGASAKMSGTLAGSADGGIAGLARDITEEVARDEPGACCYQYERIECE
jgi:hypothetical protein